MKFNDKELEELLTINEQAKILVRGLTYTEDLGEKIFDCMKNNSKLEKEYIQKAHNNYLALCLIGLNQCDSKVFKKLDEYMEENRKYGENLY